ncbi:glycosyltransferase family 15 protein [Babjeviella inositovora NRRL Y-12698]|uniref:Glycosyltransferase family 15 protein n=1 Tax=Babjeviella inositovora NRRL Y-12698 TaxID=984486 RepID=A0A1E3QTC7_9ASCO|nr:glycosyltransferase family 15 protein [Babjeviella inositovora NRRL Y-12698]ODQ80931.1 glycosyltransferase family 15 protein [Babjeviella inositovora NRRL Y-12698]
MASVMTANFKDASDATMESEAMALEAVAAFVLIAKNEDLARILQTIRHMEDRFNRRFHYDWVFLGTEEFSLEFKETITAYTSGAIKYSRIPADQWTVSPGINKPDFEKQLAAHVEETTLAHDIQEMYKNRFQAGFLARQTVLEEYDYIWKLKPGAEIHCDVDYDVFRYMKDKSSEYGFAIAYPNITPAVESLWKATRAFMKEHPQYIVKDNLMDFISDDGGASYNGCLYERNFEIASSTFWKSEAYVKYFEYLDKQPGFFELDNHWLDGMVATIATALFLPRQSIEFFQYLGVYSEPMTACPIEKAMRVAHNCGCASNVDFTWRMFSCVPRHFKLHQMEKPEGWELYGL